MSKKQSVIRKPYPLDIQFTDEEQEYYDKNKADVDKGARDLLNIYWKRSSGQVIKYLNPFDEQIETKRAYQINWDRGIGRPYSFNEDKVLETINKVREDAKVESDENRKKQLLKTIGALTARLQKARQDDIVEAENIKKETSGMEEEDFVDRGVLERRQERHYEEMYEADRQRREKEKEDKRLAEEARLKKIEDDKIAEKRAKEEALLTQQRIKFKKEEIDPATRIVGITGRISLNEIDPNNKSQAKTILKNMLVKLLLYKKIGETSKHFKIDLKKWLDKNEELGIDDEYEYDVFERDNTGFRIWWRYGVIYTTKSPKKEELVRDKWKEPLKVKLRVSSEFFEDNFLLQTLEGLGEQGRLITPEEWRAIEEEQERKRQEREKARQDREERDRLEREERKKPKTKEKLESEIYLLRLDIDALRESRSGIFGMNATEQAEVRRKMEAERNKKIKEYEERFEPYVEKKRGTGVIDNPELYEEAKAYADNIFKKPSAFKSGFIVKKYKELGGTYSGEKPETTGIARWFKEEWKDIGNKEYPVFRPTKRITLETPLTPEEIKPSNLKKQIALKQKIKGEKNLPPFEEKVGGKVVAIGVQAEKIPKQDEVWKWSNPIKVAEMAKKYLGDMAVVFRSTKPKKKYMIFDPDNKKWVHFGEINYEDFTKHQDNKRRENYLTRTANMKGNWKNNRYSANNLSRNILW